MRRQAHKGGDASFQHVHDNDAHHEERPPVGIEQLVQQIKETADKLIRDDANRGDVKLLSTALKELRYAFKVFAPYRQPAQGDGVRLGPAAGRATRRTGRPSTSAAAPPRPASWSSPAPPAASWRPATSAPAAKTASASTSCCPSSRRPTPIIAGDVKLMHLKYFFTRKLLFVKESDAVALFPGGFGTQDEGFEVLTLVQTGKSHLFPIVMVDEPGGDYWKRWQRLHRATCCWAAS